MKKLLALVILLAVAAIPSFSQAPQNALDGIYFVSYFSNNTGPGGAADQQIRLVNYGAKGTPLTSPVGDVCADIFVFDANQELVACCSCRITPNGTLTLSVGAGLTGNPVTSVISERGDIKIVALDATTVASCGGLATGAGLVSVKAFATHLQTSGGTSPGSFVTETNVPAATFSNFENTFLYNACTYARYLGSGKGTCSCK